MTAPVDPTARGRTPFFRLADTVGDGTGTKNAIGDMTSTPLYLKAQPGETLYVERLIVLIEDGSFPSSENYGDLASPLTNGIGLYVANWSGSKIQDITDPDYTIKSNMAWSVYCHDVLPVSFGTGNDGISIRWTFGKSGLPITLHAGEAIVVDINDNLTGLIGHYFEFQGVREFQGTT